MYICMKTLSIILLACQNSYNPYDLKVEPIFISIKFSIKFSNIRIIIVIFANEKCLQAQDVINEEFDDNTK